MVHEYTLITRYVVLLYVHMYEHTPNTFSREASTFFRLDRKEQFYTTGLSSWIAAGARSHTLE